MTHSLRSGQAQHPLAESRRLFLAEAGRLEGCRLAYEQRGDWYSACSLERAIEHIGESVRILDKLLAATTWGEEPE